MQLKHAWWYEELLCMPGVPDEIIHFFGQRFPPTPPLSGGGGSGGRLGMPAPVCVRLFLRHLRDHPDTGSQDVLEILSYVDGLTSLFPSQFRPGVGSIKPTLALTLEVRQSGSDTDTHTHTHTHTYTHTRIATR